MPAIGEKKLKIKVHEREKKAIIRFTHPAEIEWFKRHMASLRDSDPKTHPPITLKDEYGTIRFAKPKPIVPMVNPVSPVKIDPEHPPVLNPQNITAIPINPKVEALPPLHRGTIKPKKELKKDDA